jgi:UDP-glucuronate 4-epimerase
MRAVVTGAAGFIGSHLSERLVAEGWNVVGIDAFTPYYERSEKEANLTALAGESAFQLIEGDVADVALDRIFADRPVVFHLAAQPGVRASFGDGFVDYSQHNLTATQRLFGAALDASCPRVVWASSSSVYGDAEAYPCFEASTPLQPRSPYGVTKRAGEDIARIYGSLGLSVVALRYFTVYGPRQRPDMAMRRLCESAVRGGSFPLFGDGQQSRDFTFVADAVDATFRSGLTADVPPILNVGGGEEASMNEVIATIEELAGHRLEIERGQVQRGDVRRTAADTSLARDSLGWQPLTSVRDGLALELGWLRRRVADEVSVGATS